MFGYLELDQSLERLLVVHAMPGQRSLAAIYDVSDKAMAL